LQKLPVLVDRRILVGPSEGSPRTGTELLQTFLKHPSISPGLRYELRDFVLSIRTTVVEHDKKGFEMAWKNFVEAERQVYERIQDPSPFQSGSTDGLGNHGLCRYILFKLEFYLITLDHLGSLRMSFTSYSTVLESRKEPILISSRLPLIPKIALPNCSLPKGNAKGKDSVLKTASYLTHSLDVAISHQQAYHHLLAINGQPSEMFMIRFMRTGDRGEAKLFF
jgi:hypothetical protein